MTRHALRIDIPAALWLSANARLHWGEAARRTRALRRSASVIARGAGLAGLGLARASVTVEVHRPRAGRADAANAAPAVKAVIDGLTDAGLWADDDDKQSPLSPTWRGPYQEARLVRADHHHHHHRGGIMTTLRLVPETPGRTAPTTQEAGGAS